MVTSNWNKRAQVKNKWRDILELDNWLKKIIYYLNFTTLIEILIIKKIVKTSILGKKIGKMELKSLNGSINVIKLTVILESAFNLKDVLKN